MSPSEDTFQVATPELGGLVAPTIVGSSELLTDPVTGLAVSARMPIDERVSTAVRRALKYATLGEKPNAEKRLALIYYNYPPGKACIGASYLNVGESLARVLAALAEDGYDVSGTPPDTERVLTDITTKARNVGGFAPGELAEMLAAGNAVRIPLERYRS